MDLAYKFILLATSIACVSSVEFCEPITIETCSSAGYGSTARFPDVDGQPYQDVQASRLNIYIPLLTSCSKFASTILCSLYVPKCEESQRTPLVPCRKVCTNFVGECLDTLRIAGLAGMFTALCDLLPDENILSKNCFYPWKFNDTSSQAPSTSVCHGVTHQTCRNDLHYNNTFIPPNLQTLGLADTVFKSVIESKCSTEFEKFLCFTQFPPCDPNRPSRVMLPCKSLCDTIDKKCWREFKKAKIPLPHCDFVYPRMNSSTGLCEVTEWPAAWPKKFRPAPPPLGTCEDITVQSCSNAGYKLTAKFGTAFQVSKGRLLDTMLPYVQLCSPYSSLILCSLFLPKCIPGSGRPMLPCRQVCLDFARKCVNELRLVSTAGMTTALCDLLPVFDGTPDKCILPSGFQPTDLITVSTRNVCYNVTSTKCSADLHYDKTFLPSDDQRASEMTILQPIINSQCSPDIEKYLCYTRLPPCSADTSVVHLPCRELCQRITRDCGDVFKANYIPPLDCDYLFPPGDSESGLCNMKQWPAPWPWKIPQPVPPTSAGPTQCVPLKANACLDAGYDLTAAFPGIDGRPYQQVKSKSLNIYLSFLRSCSKYSEAVMCSLFMPKCVEGVQRPILPCRSVCLEFVASCQHFLSLASHAGLFRALCDLLPEQDMWPNTCFVPKGFKPTIPAVAKRGGTCSKVIKPRYCTTDLHYNLTFVPVEDQSDDTILQAILNSKCSADFEKYLCYTSTPLCKPNDLSVYVPCRDICEQIKRDCAEDFQKHSIPIPDCSWIYPDETHPTGLCALTTFPAPWPAKRVDSTRGANEPQKAKNKGGLIAGLVILVFVVIAAVLIAVVYLRWRGETKQFTAQRFENESRDQEL